MKGPLSWAEETRLPPRKPRNVREAMDSLSYARGKLKDCCSPVLAVSRDRLSSQTDAIKERKAIREESKVGFFASPC